MRCRNCRRNPSAEDIQNVVYEIGRREPFLDAVKKGKDGRPGVSLDWFNMLYQVLLGQEKGPRFGSFVAVYGLANAVAMIDGALARSAKGEPHNAEAIRKIALQALNDALQIHALVALLRKQNSGGITGRLSKAGAATATAATQNAMIGYLVILVARAYAEPKIGDTHLRAGADMLKIDNTAREIFDSGNKLRKIADFEEHWAKCRSDHRLQRIKNFRDKQTAHLGKLQDIPEPEYRELFEFGEATAEAMELLALATGVSTKLIKDNDDSAASAEAFWKPWIKD